MLPEDDLPELPERTPEQEAEFARQWQADRDAFLRLRDRPDRPSNFYPGTTGGAELEARLNAGKPWPVPPASPYHFDAMRGHVQWLEQPDPERNLAYFFWERGEWAVDGFAAIVNECFVISSISFTPNPTAHMGNISMRREQNFVPPNGVVSATLRFPIERLRSYIQQALLSAPERLREWEKYRDFSYSAERHEEVESAASAVRDSGRVIGRARGDQDIEETARLYLRLLGEGISKGIIPQMAKELYLSEDAVRARIKKATRHGYLSHGNRGRAGRLPGPKLLEKG